MTYNLPGHPPTVPTSLVPPLLQVALGVGLLWLAWWANDYAKVVRATDAFAFNGLSVIAVLAGVLWMPFALTALVRVLRNRRNRAQRSAP